MSQQKHDDARAWMESRVWANGFKPAPDGSVNAAVFRDQYNRNKELWDAMFRFLADSPLDTLASGTHQIVEGRCWATVSEYTPRTPEKVRVESHRRFIDLQYVLCGNEKMGIAQDKAILTPYNESRDVAFWTSDSIEYHKATPDSFFLFFPDDLHQPSVADGPTATSRKIVIKIEYLP